MRRTIFNQAKNLPLTPIETLEALRAQYQKRIESVGVESPLFDLSVYTHNLGAIKALSEAINIITLNERDYATENLNKQQNTKELK